MVRLSITINLIDGIGFLRANMALCDRCKGTGKCKTCNKEGHTNSDEYGDDCLCPLGPCCGHCHDDCDELKENN